MRSACLFIFAFASFNLYAQSSSPFDNWDKNRDGKLVREELPENLRKNFDRVDRDGDGFISRKEDEAVRNRNRRPPQDARLPRGVKLMKDLSYAGNDNPRQMLDLALPENPTSDKLPVVVFIHGGGWKGGDKSRGIGRVVPYVASGNYAGASIGYRLSAEAQWPSQIQDCKAAIRWIKAHAKTYGLDAEKIGVWGSSAGGHLVSMLGVSGGVEALEGSIGAHPDQNSRVTCVVNYFGPSQLWTMSNVKSNIDHNAPDSPESLLIGGAIQENLDKAKSASPMTYVTSDDAPILHAHGTKDMLVPFNQAEVLHAALEKANVDTTLITMKNGGHGFRHPELEKQVRLFFDKHLRGVDAELHDVTLDVKP